MAFIDGTVVNVALPALQKDRGNHRLGLRRSEWRGAAQKRTVGRILSSSPPIRLVKAGSHITVQTKLL
jgi:hypothetical protein